MRVRAKLTVPLHLINEPLIDHVAGRCNVVPSIRRARVTETAGDMVLELEGSRESLVKSIQALRERNVEVELVEGDVVE
jgi:ABC-type methionine transport system ATPase subunit